MGNKKLMLHAREKERRAQLLLKGVKKEKDPFTRAITAPQIESFNTRPGDEEAKIKEEQERKKKEEEEKKAKRKREQAMNTLSLDDLKVNDGVRQVEVQRRQTGARMGMSIDDATPCAPRGGHR